ncbi:MAG TPA: FG-GAP-like repeat-containing protein, partial [bacterium]
PLKNNSAAEFLPVQHKKSAIDFYENPQPNANPELTLVQNSSLREPVLDLNTETLTRAQPMTSPKLEIEDNGADSDFDDLPVRQNDGNKHYYLLGIYGYYLGRKFRLRHPDTRIGRDGKANDIVIRKNSRGELDQSVSRRHATISYRNGKYVILDKRSKSRTYLNQAKIEPADNLEIQPRDEIEIISDRKSHILRMVPEGEWDFSYPKKAGSWHIRHRLRLIGLGSLLLMAVAATFFSRSLLMRNLIADKPDTLMVSEAAWFSTGKGPDNGDTGALMPNHPAIADFDGDRFVDMAYVDDKGTLFCINGKTQKTLWSIGDFQVSPGAPITVEDLNKDGRPDVIVVSKDLRVRALDGRLGIEIWKSPILAGPLIAPPAIADFNKDGLKDLAIASEANAIYVGYLSLRNARWVKLDIEAPLRGVVSAADLSGDGTQKIIFGTETGKIIFIDGANQKILGEINVNEEFSKATGIFGQNHQIRYPVAIGDVNGDQVKDMVVLTEQSGLLALSGVNLERLWYDLPDSSAYREGGLNQNLLLGDLDGDNLLDVVYRTPNGWLRALKGDGEGKDRKMILWEKSDHYYSTFPALADFNKNGTLDVVTADVTGQLFIIEGSTSEILWTNGTQGAPLIGPPLIGDLDDDHRLDLVALKTDGKVAKLGTNSVHAQSGVIWGQVFGNSKNTNSIVATPQDSMVHYAYMAGSLVLIASVLAFNYRIRKKRWALSKA